LPGVPGAGAASNILKNQFDLGSEITLITVSRSLSIFATLAGTS
jgi:hypothetical protein